MHYSGAVQSTPFPRLVSITENLSALVHSRFIPLKTAALIGMSNFCDARHRLADIITQSCRRSKRGRPGEVGKCRPYFWTALLAQLVQKSTIQVMMMLIRHGEIM
jgi:hypothetical protein